MNLDNMYKEASRVSHEHALQVIFDEGVKQGKLLGMPPEKEKSEKEIVSQALNMGKTFLK